jgi:hypothetical protein
MFDGFAYRVEWTDSLTGTAVWSASEVEESVISEDATAQEMRARLPRGSASNRFVRLKVTRP